MGFAIVNKKNIFGTSITNRFNFIYVIVFNAGIKYLVQTIQHDNDLIIKYEKVHKMEENV